MSTRQSTDLKGNLSFCFSFQFFFLWIAGEGVSARPQSEATQQVENVANDNSSICGAICSAQLQGKWKVLPTIPLWWESLYRASTDNWYKSWHSVYPFTRIRIWELHNQYKVSMGPRIRHCSYLKKNSSVVIKVNFKRSSYPYYKWKCNIFLILISLIVHINEKTDISNIH